MTISNRNTVTKPHNKIGERRQKKVEGQILENLFMWLNDKPITKRHPEKKRCRLNKTFFDCFVAIEKIIMFNNRCLVDVAILLANREILVRNNEVKM